MNTNNPDIFPDIPVSDVNQRANSQEWSSGSFSFEDEAIRNHRLEQEAKDNEHQRKQENRENECRLEQQSRENKSKLEKDRTLLILTGSLVSLFFICSGIIVFYAKSTEEQKKNAYTGMGAIVTALVGYYVGNNQKTD